MTHSLHAQWEPSKEALRDILSPEDAESWLNGLHLAQLSPERAVLEGVPNAFFHKRIARHFAPLLRDSLRRAFPEQALPGDFELQLRVCDTEPAAPQGQSPSLKNATGPATPSAFDRFHTGEENRIPWSLARQVAQEPGGRYNPFFLVGASGCGKSHLMSAIAEALGAGRPEWRIVQESAETYTTQVLDGMRRKRMPAVREHYRGADALLLDDLAFIEMSAKAQEELLYTYEALLAAGKQMVFAAERPPSALLGLGETLRSRLETALVAELQPPGLMARQAIVRASAQRAGLALEDADILWLAERVAGNPRKLEGVVLRVAAYAGLAGQTLASGTVRELAAPWEEPEAGTGAQVSPKAVLAATCAEFNLTLKQLRSRERSAQRDKARLLAMLLLRDACGLSFGEIGRLVGNRANSTVLEGIAAVRERLKHEPSLAQVHGRLKGTLPRLSALGDSTRIRDRTRFMNDISGVDGLNSPRLGAVTEQRPLNLWPASG